MCATQSKSLFDTFLKQSFWFLTLIEMVYNWSYTCKFPIKKQTNIFFTPWYWKSLLNLPYQWLIFLIVYAAIDPFPLANINNNYYYLLIFLIVSGTLTRCMHDQNWLYCAIIDLLISSDRSIFADSLSKFCNVCCNCWGFICAFIPAIV